MAADASVTMKYNADTTTATSNVNTLGSSIKKAGVLLAAAFSIKKIYEIGTAFEESFAKASTLIDETAVSLAGLSEDVIELSNETGVAADEINEALYQALSAGVDISEDGADALAFLEQNVKLAEGGFTDLTTAVDATTTIINAYGLEVSDINSITDTLIMTQNEGKTTVDKLASSMSTVIPQAAALGVGLDQVGAAFASMTAQGEETSEAATKIRAMMIDLSSSSSTAATTFERLAGESFSEFIASGGTVSEALSMMKGYADENNVSISDLFSNVRSGSAALMLSSETGMAKFNESLEAITESAGATNDAFETVTDTAGYSMEKSFNKMKNAGIKAFDAISPVVEGLAVVLSAVAAALTFIIEGFDGTNTVATIVLSLMIALVAVYAAYLIILNAQNISQAIYIALLKVTSVVMGIVSIAAQAMGVSMTLALGVIGLIILAIAALIAILIIFCKNEMAQEAKRIKGELEDLNDELKKSNKSIESEAEASSTLADEFMVLANKANKTTDDIAEMTAKAEMLNDVLGDGTVVVDENTGAVTVNGEALEDNADALYDLIKANKTAAKIEATTTAAEEARTLQAEALANQELAIADANGKNTRALRKATEAYEEATALVDQYDEILTDLTATQLEEEAAIEELEATAAAAVTEEEKNQAIREQLEEDRELSTQEHYDALQEMMASNYEELGLTEKEYIEQMAEHQQAINDAYDDYYAEIEEATQEHLDTMFALNDEGLYDEARTVEELNAIWLQNQLDMANYYTNLELLSEAGFTELAQVFTDGGVEMGGSLQNVMDDLQGITLDGWKEIKADWEANGGHLSDTMKEKFGDVNVEAGLAVLELNETTKSGFEDAATYGAEAIDPLVDDVTETYEDVNDAVETTGEEIADTSEEAGENAAQGFVDGVEDNLDDVAASGVKTGTNYVSGIIAGLEAMTAKLIKKVILLALKMNNAFDATLDIRSPSGVGKKSGGYYPLGVAEGVDENARYAVDSVENMAAAMINAGDLINTPVYSGSGNSSSVIYNNEQNINANYQPIISQGAPAELQYLDFQRKLKMGFAL